MQPITSQYQARKLTSVELQNQGFEKKTISTKQISKKEIRQCEEKVSIVGVINSVLTIETCQYVYLPFNSPSSNEEDHVHLHITKKYTHMENPPKAKKALEKALKYSSIKMQQKETHITELVRKRLTQEMNKYQLIIMLANNTKTLLTALLAQSKITEFNLLIFNWLQSNFDLYIKNLTEHVSLIDKNVSSLHKEMTQLKSYLLKLDENKKPDLATKIEKAVRAAYKAGAYKNTPLQSKQKNLLSVNSLTSTEQLELSKIVTLALKVTPSELSKQANNKDLMKLSEIAEIAKAVELTRLTEQAKEIQTLTLDPENSWALPTLLEKNLLQTLNDLDQKTKKNIAKESVGIIFTESNLFELSEDEDDSSDKEIVHSSSSSLCYSPSLTSESSFSNVSSSEETNG